MSACRERPNVGSTPSDRPPVCPALQALVASVAQVAVAVYVRNWAWWQVILAGHVVGGVMANNLTAALHECCHYLIFRTPSYNKYLSYVINCPLGIPAAVGFRKYHLEHHSDMVRRSYPPQCRTCAWVLIKGRTGSDARLKRVVGWSSRRISSRQRHGCRQRAQGGWWWKEVGSQKP